METRIKRLILLGIGMLMMSGCVSTPQRDDERFARSLERSKIGLVLDQWHSAASNGNFARYFDAISDDGVFLGTDASERWAKSQFMAYAKEPFADGEGWTYHPRDRFVSLSDDGTTAWADELLDNDHYGTLRGTAVLVLVDHKWKIAHYSLTFLVPNELAPKVVELIKADGDG